MVEEVHHDKTAFMEALERDETLYSFLATAHAMGSGISSEKTSLNLLGIRHGARQYVLPARIDPELYGWAGDPANRLPLIRHHTIAGFYLPFLSREEQEIVARRLGTVAYARRQCDGSSRTLRPDHPLKACTECAAADIEKIGRPYWHLAHQLPLATACAKHRAGLIRIEGRNKRWLIPDTSTLDRASSPAELSDVALKLAGLCESVIAMEFIDVESLRQATIFRLQQLGVLHDARSALHSRLTRWFQGTSTSRWLRGQSSWTASLANGEWMATLLWRRKSSHAIRWVALWSAIESEDPSKATAAFDAALKGRCVEGAGQLALFDSDLPCGSAPSHVVAAFAASQSYGEAMRSLTASRGDVVRWLESYPDLRRTWRARLRQERLEAILQSIGKTLEGNSDLTRQELEHTHSGELRWLKEHAPAELNRIRAKLHSRADPQRRLFET